MARGIEIKVGADTAAAEQGAKKVERAFKSAIDNTSANVRNLRSSIGGLNSALTALATAGALKQLGQLGIDLDKARNSMAALTGGIENANKKLGQLRELAKSSPGVTTSFATDLFNQLKVVGTISDQTIDRVIKSLGKLNTVFSGVGPDFARNLTQIFTQGFERADIKEALGRVPIFEQLLERAFGTKDPDKLRKLKEAGKLTLGGFLSGFAEAINTDPRLKNATESLGGKLQKSLDETKLKLAELGERLLRDFLPVLDKILPPLNSLLDVFKQLPTGLQAAAIGFVALAGPIGSTVRAIRELTVAITALDFAGKGSGLLTLGKLGLVGAAAGGVGAAILLSGKANTTPQQAARDAGIGPNLPPDLQRQLSGIIAQSGQRQGIADNLKRLGLTGKQLAEGLLGLPKDGAGKPTPLPKDLTGSGRTGPRKLTRTEEQLIEVSKTFLEESDRLIKGAVDGLEEINKTLTDERLEQARRLTERQEQLAGSARSRAKRLEEIDADTARFVENTRRASVAAFERDARRDLSRSGRFIDDALNRGQITAGEAELLGQGANRELANKLRELIELKRQSGDLDNERLADLQDEIALLDRLGVSISNSERFMRGFNSATESVGDAFERFGQNVSKAFTNVRDLLGGLKRAFLSFFNDLLGQGLQGIMRSLLGPLLGGGSSGGGGGLFGNIFGSVLGGGTAGGLFRTAPTFPGASATGIFANGVFAAGLAGLTPRGTGFGSILPTATSGLSKLLGNIGLGQGGALGAFGLTGPLLGGLLGAGLGGTSTLGRIAGAIGGGAVGLGAAFGASVFGAGGGLAQAALAFAGPAGLIGLPLLIGSFFLGKASQRRKDEAASGDFLTQALAQIRDLKRQVSIDQIDGSAARSVFENQILAQFIAQINQLKTKSVRESRLTNQVRDLRAVFDAELGPEIAAQARRRRVNASLIPEFALGGIVHGRDRGFDSVAALLRPGEMVLTREHQAAISSMAGAGVFARAGVPDAGIQTPSGQAFVSGGRVSDSEPLVIELDVHVGMSESGAEEIFATGGRTSTGRRVVVNAVRRAQGDREL